MTFISSNNEIVSHPFLEKFAERISLQILTQALTYFEQTKLLPSVLVLLSCLKF
jgi:hypothetical protein